MINEEKLTCLQLFYKTIKLKILNLVKQQKQKIQENTICLYNDHLKAEGYITNDLAIIDFFEVAWPFNLPTFFNSLDFM